jgi:hypothetical protein
MVELLTSVILIMLYIYSFWVVYIGVMGIYRAYLDKRLSSFILYLLYPFVLLGIAMDVFANLVIAPIVFLDLPKELLVTTRLIRYKINDKGWRGLLADKICRNLLDVFDPTGSHCQ